MAMANDSLQTNEYMDFFIETTSNDYPVSVYYIDLANMFSGQVHHHWHDKIEIDWVRSGSAIFQVGEKTTVVNTGEAVFINRDQIHSIRPIDGEKTVILSVLFHHDYIFEQHESLISAKYKNPITNDSNLDCCKFTNGSVGLDYIKSIVNCNLNKSYGFELITKGLLCNLWIELLMIADSKQSLKKLTTDSDVLRSKDAMLYMQKHFDKDLTLEEIASNIHLSKSEFCRCFKRTTASTPFEYLMHYRVYRSAIIMQRQDQSKVSISSLASSCGFNNASYFNKIFKKYLGITPSEYRDIIKKSHRDALNPYGISIAKM